MYEDIKSVVQIFSYFVIYLWLLLDLIQEMSEFSLFILIYKKFAYLQDTLRYLKVFPLYVSFRVNVTISSNIYCLLMKKFKSFSCSF